ncbi:uncharacterized protein LOC126744693 [Anthonomus grandis grandis]|uniref:uncharacterized protein LOC126744693 n=1 Tax=Anthonomus grandis grandis TaxID=2921223 RepID=UPI00216594F4|nr:uncharacterized protein LOC126744693 [Anthonomus grandis grandis]
MRLKNFTQKPFICLCFLVQVTLAQQNVYNNNFKNNQRTYSKKYYAPSTAKPPNNLTKKPLFPNLDNIKSRIAKLDSARGPSASNSDIRYKQQQQQQQPIQTFFTPLPKLRHHGWSNRRHTTSTTTTLSPFDEDIFNNYGDLEEEPSASSVNDLKYAISNKKSANSIAGGSTKVRHYGRSRTSTTTTNHYDLFDDSHFDDEDDDEEDLDEPEDDDDYQAIFDSIQAEEPSISVTEPSRLVLNYQESSLTAEKWDKLGTASKVQKARNDYYKIDQTKQLRDHVRRINQSGMCKKPVPKVVQVYTEHPDPSVRYFPECTLLHRCAEDTGCCRSDSTCQYKTREEVTLYFYVKPLGAGEYMTTNLTFFNHTECQCRSRKSLESTTTTERIKRVADHLNEVDNLEVSLNNSPEMLTKCKCPKHFIPKLKSDSTCYCDCDIINKACLMMKKGKEHLSYSDRVCILNGECQTVACQYGSYNNEVGKCPTFEES